MEGILIIEEKNIDKLADRITERVMKNIEEEKKSKSPWLSTKQLSEEFPYSMEWFRDKINAGFFGKKAFNGDCMAKLKEVEKYIFDINH